MEGTVREGSLGVVSTISRDKEVGEGEESYTLLMEKVNRKRVERIETWEGVR